MIAVVTFFSFLLLLIFGVTWGVSVNDPHNGAIAAALTRNTFYATVGWVFVWFALVTPYRLWKEQAVKIQKLTTPLLTASVADMPIQGGNTSVRFKIHNGCAEPIERCYGKLHKYKVIMADRTIDEIPHDGIPIYWDWRTHQASTYATIGPNSDELLSLGILQPEHTAKEIVFWHLLSVDVSDRRNVKNLPIPPGDYEFTLEIGAKQRGCKPRYYECRLLIPKYKLGVAPTVDLRILREVATL